MGSPPGLPMFASPGSSNARQECPSSKWIQGAEWIVPDYRPGGWLQYYKDTQGVWGAPGSVGRVGPCQEVYPPGWGGVVTDSFLQQTCADWESGYFEFSYGINVGHYKAWPSTAGLTLSAVGDSSKYIIVGEMGSAGGPLFTVMDIAYPYAHSGFSTICSWCGCGDWSNCSWSQVCGVGFGDDAKRFATDPSYRNNKYTVHMGGQNLGFADGHAKWYSASNILAEAPRYEQGGCCGALIYKGLEGVIPDGPTMPANGGAWTPGFPCGQTYPLLY
jgi:prepilin-type processing-associated H-X9-DG protein